MLKLLPACIMLALLAAVAPPAATPVVARKPARKKSSRSRKKARPRPTPASAKVREAARKKVEEMVAQAAAIPLENPAALVPFFEQLYRHQNGEMEGPVRILHYGDSHTAADEWTGMLRALFQSRFGDGGPGFAYAGRPWLGYRRLDVHASATRGWKAQGLTGKPGDGLHGLGGLSVWTTRPNESVALEAECRTLEVFYLRQPGGGRIGVSDDGERVETVSTAGETGPGYLHYDAEPGLHRFEIRTLERAPVRLLGWAAENSRGVTYETLGINGAQASIVLGWDEPLLASNMARRDPALVVLAYGTNEAGNRGWTPEPYREMYTALIERIRKAAPAASILVIGPPDRLYRSRGRWLPFPNIDGVIQAQRAVALAHGCAFWDLRAKMGGMGAMRQWALAGLAQYDHVHLTAVGYRNIGQALFSDLMGPYDTFTSLREKLSVDERANGTRDQNP